jgi:hypothetical protein
MSLGLDEQAPLADWETGLKAMLGAKKKALSAIKNPSLKHKAERECADIEEAARMASQLSLFGRLRRYIQEDKQETFEWELRKPDNQAALPKEEESAFGDYLDLKGEARKKWPAFSFPVAKPAVVAAPATPAPAAPPAPIAVPAPPPPVAPALPPLPTPPPPVAPAVPPTPALVPPAAPPVIASAPQVQAATRPEPVADLTGSINKGATATTIPGPTLRQTVPESPAMPPVAVKPSLQPTEFGPPPVAPPPVADQAALVAAPDKATPTTGKVLRKGEQPHRILWLIWQFFTLVKAMAAGKALLYVLGGLVLAIAGFIAKDEFSRASRPKANANRTGSSQVVALEARLSVASQPGGVTVTLNGESKPTPAEFTLKPGSYKVEASREDYWPTNANIALKQGQHFALSFVDPGLPGAASPLPEAGGNSAVVPLSIKYARLAVNSPSGNATASVNGQSQTTPAKFRLRPGQYDVRLALEGFFATNIPVPLKPDQDLTLTLQDASKPSAEVASNDPNKIRVPLQARSVPPVAKEVPLVAKEVPPVAKEVPPAIKDARLVVTTVPSTARVSLNTGNERREQAAPATFEPLRPGSYDIEAIAPGYFAKTETIKLAAGENRRLVLELEELRAKVTVRTEPAGAQVYLDGVLQFERTPATRLLAKPGNHELRVELEGYKRQLRQIHAASADPLLVDFGRLVPQSATLTIRSTPDHAAIKLGGTGRATTGTTPQTFEVTPPGQCTMEVTLAGYETATRTVSLADGDRKEIDFPLKARKVTLSVRTDPTGASVYVGGTKFGSTDENLEIAPGRYDIELRKAGYQTVSRRVTLSPGVQPAPLAETLAPIQPPPPAIVQDPPPRPVSIQHNEPPPAEYISSEKLIQICRDEAARIEQKGEKGNGWFTPAAAKEEKKKWEAWKGEHQSQWSPELQKAYTSIIRAINMHTQGAM